MRWIFLSISEARSKYRSCLKSATDTLLQNSPEDCMKSLRHFSQTQAHLALAPAITNHGDFTKTRIRLHIPPDYQQEPVISRLSSDYGLSVNITGAKLAATTQAGIFELELRGTPQQIQTGLTYLRSLNVKVIGKPNAEGDSWHY